MTEKLRKAYSCEDLSEETKKQIEELKDFVCRDYSKASTNRFFVKVYAKFNRENM